MPRQARLDAPGTLHHVIARGIERSPIFKEEADYEDFLRRLETTLGSTGASLFGWALIPNHFHLVLRTGDVPLPTVMRRVMTGYAVAFNLRHQRSGHVFQNRYRSIVCEAEQYLLELIRYVHLNPLRAGLVSSIDDLRSFPYCGHAALMGRVDRPWQQTAEILARFGQNLEHARRRYEDFLLEAPLRQHRPELVGGGLKRSYGAWLEKTRRQTHEDEQLAYDERVLGSSAFVQQVLADAEWERREALRKARVPLSVVAAEVSARTGVGGEELRSGRKRPEAVRARRAFIRLAVGELQHSGAAVARYLRLTASAVNRQVQRDGEDDPLTAELRITLRERFS